MEYENAILRNNLKTVERKKMAKTVKPPTRLNDENADHATQSKQHTRCSDKSSRMNRKRDQFLAKRKSVPVVAVDEDKLQHLNPINLSEHGLSNDQNN